MAGTAQSGKLEIIISAEEIQKRVRAIARQISNDYSGKTIHALAVLERAPLKFR
jgi:hypoxanthine-guanine phosphoribosyltransferase